MMRAKMKVSSVEIFEASERLNLRAVCKSEGYPADGGDENNTFAKFTPSADLTMTVTNPDLIGKIKPGMEFYVDFTEAK